MPNFIVTTDFNLIRQIPVATYPGGQKCWHCQWVRDRKIRGKDAYALVYDRDSGDGAFVFLSVDMFSYAFNLTKTRHDTSNNVAFMMQAARFFAQHMSNTFTNSRMVINSSYDNSRRSKEHQHVWVVFDSDKRKFDNMFGTIGGFEVGKRGRTISDKPYPGDTIIESECSNVATMKDPISLIRRLTNINTLNFYVFSSMINGYCDNGFKVSF